MNITRVKMEPYDVNKHGQLREFDNTKLVALNTCPTWGIVRYELHRTYLSGSRAMALEAGGAAHESYAAIRLADLYFNGRNFYPDLPVTEIATARATQLFGSERTEGWLQVLNNGEDSERAIVLGALEIFGTSGYYEDPNDRKRTIANIEEALIGYCERYPIGQTMPVVIGEFVGVEIPIDMYLEIDTDEFPHDSDEEYKTYKFRFVGRVDGVHFTDTTLQHISVEENKTASRLDDAWRMSFTVSHQPTGYMLAIESLLGREVRNATIRGMAIPLPKSYDYGGIVNEPIYRNEQHFIEWAHWVVHTMNITEPYLEQSTNAPKYTHSCNRYFRPCPLIPFCDSDPEERQLMLDEMEVQKWSPLEEGNS